MAVAAGSKIVSCGGRPLVLLLILTLIVIPAMKGLHEEPIMAFARAFVEEHGAEITGRRLGQCTTRYPNSPLLCPPMKN
uniref:Uncharacterized protein n=1 Tax=Leersia perrieri TaxID=77586 RepID=A0A0D9XXU8_9ORYZ